MNRFHQRRNMLWRGMLVNAVAQIENVSGTRLSGVGMGFAKTVKNPNHFFFDAIGRRKEDIGIDVPLQRLAGAAHLATHHSARFAQVHGPVKPQDFTVELTHFV